jgi:large conductance mechanosensitive channel
MGLFAKLEKSMVWAIALGFVIGATLLSLLNTFAGAIVMPLISWLFGGIDLSSEFTTLVEPSEDNLQGVTLAWGQFLDTAITCAVILLVVWLGVKIYASGKVSLPKVSVSSKKK